MTTDLIEIEEARLVEQIFADPGWRSGIGIPPQMSGSLSWRLAVAPQALGLAASELGDIDALVVEEGHPDVARATEFKRVKLSERAFTADSINKLGELKKVVKQANVRARVGFAFVWITVVVVADMRSQVTATSMYPLIPMPLMERVRAALPLADLDPRVGVSICDISQISAAPAQNQGLAGWSLLRSATSVPQPARLTAAIERLFSSRAT